MYNAIIVLDEKRNRNYYYSYVAENGNIECGELPPYADIDKAQACYWDGAAWVFDPEKHAEISAARAAEREAERQAQLEAGAEPANAELALAVMELADNISAVMEAVTELAAEVAVLKGGE